MELFTQVVKYTETALAIMGVIAYLTLSWLILKLILKILLGLFVIVHGAVVDGNFFTLSIVPAV